MSLGTALQASRRGGSFGLVRTGLLGGFSWAEDLRADFCCGLVLLELLDTSVLNSKL